MLYLFFFSPIVRLVIKFHKVNFSLVIDSEIEKLIHGRKINNRDKQCRFIYQFVRVTFLEIHFGSGAARYPEWFFSCQDLDPDPAKSLGYDRIRMHNTGTYTWTTFKRAKIPISKSKPSMIVWYLQGTCMLKTHLVSSSMICSLLNLIVWHLWIQSNVLPACLASYLTDFPF